MPTKWTQLISTNKLTLLREDETWQFQNSKTCAPNYLESRLSRSNAGFWGEEKTGKKGKKPSEQRREATTNLSQIAFLIGPRVLSSLRHPNPQSLTRKEISISRLNVLLLTCFCHSDSAPHGLISTRQTGNALENTNRIKFKNTKLNPPLFTQFP